MRKLIRRKRKAYGRLLKRRSEDNRNTEKSGDEDKEDKKEERRKSGKESENVRGSSNCVREGEELCECVRSELNIGGVSF